jgi:hypothetical protein
LALTLTHIEQIALEAIRLERPEVLAPSSALLAEILDGLARPS